MSRIFCILIYLILSTTAFAQQADQRIRELLSRGDWFTLQETYARVKNNIQSQMLKRMTESMLGIYFNLPENAISNINALLNYHQNEMGFANTTNMIFYKSILLGNLGQYEASAKNLESFFEQIEPFTSIDNYPQHQILYKMYDPIRSEPKTELVRPDTDTEIPLNIEQIGSGSLMFIPVQIKGKEYQFILDTGSGTTYLSDRFAKEIGLRIVRDSVLITGIKQAYGKTGTIDKLIIGNMEYHNPLITIGTSDPEVDAIHKVDAVLGLDFLKAVGECVLYPEEGKVVFPINQNALPATGVNLMVDDSPYMLVKTEGKELLMHFDTGNVGAELHNTYYTKNKTAIEANGTKDNLSGGGFGGMRSYPIFRLPSFPLKVGNVAFTLKNLQVNTERASAAQKNEDGALGMAFITQFRKVIINFDKMFVSVEK